LFEIGKTHVKGKIDEEQLPLEMEHLALVIAADEKTAKSKASGAAYYAAKKYAELLTSGQATYEPIKSFDYPMTGHFAEGRSAVIKIGSELVGVIGEFNQKVMSALKMPEYSAGLELDIQRIRRLVESKKYQPLPELPGTQQDL